MGNLLLLAYGLMAIFGFCSFFIAWSIRKGKADILECIVIGGFLWPVSLVCIFLDLIEPYHNRLSRFIHDSYKKLEED